MKLYRISIYINFSLLYFVVIISIIQRWFASAEITNFLTFIPLEILVAISLLIGLMSFCSLLILNHFGSTSAHKQISARVLIWQILFLLASYGVAGDHNFFETTHLKNKAASGSQQTFTVSTFNAQNLKGGIEKFISSIKQLDTDIILICENSLRDSDINKLNQMLTTYSRYTGRLEGTAIFSKIPLITFKEVTLPSHQASLSKNNDIIDIGYRRRRSFSHGIIKIANQNVHLISLRFIAGRTPKTGLMQKIIWSKYLLNEQRKEVKYLLSYIENLEGPIIIGGDLNALPRSSTIAEMKKTLYDSFLEINRIGQFTFNAEKGRFLRLDYIFYKGSIKAVNSSIGNRISSDHLPVVTKFAMETF